MHSTDFLVIGSGVAGMWFAIKASEYGTVTMITKTELRQSNSAFAQGGIAAVWDPQDSHDSHISDTLIAGAGLCKREAVEITVREGPDRVREIIALGAEFTRKLEHPEDYSLHQEGGHSIRRILHAADCTGQEMVRALAAKCLENDRITILERHIAINVVTASWMSKQTGEIPHEDDTAVGAYALNRETGEVKRFGARVVVLATGGAGKVYTYTTNPPIASGDGHAMAWRAGAQMANMEFVQFHPTCLHHPDEHSFLVSEALRGEGGKLIHADGTRFMPGYDPREELAPRDIVARAIDAELKRTGAECVYLDMRHLERATIERAFPTIHSRLMSLGIDMVTTPIPVVPAAHYMCGGVRTGAYGESSIGNLFAIGEVSCTGLHGANRLASNSLLEALVFAERAAHCAGARLSQIPLPATLPTWEQGEAIEPDELVVITQTWGEIRQFMWNYVGIVRTHRRLKRAQRRIQLVQEEIGNYYWDFRLTSDLIELRNLASVAEMIVMCALKRRESRGLHYTLDFPDSDPRFLKDTLIVRRR